MLIAGPLLAPLKLWEDVALQRMGRIHFTKRDKVTLVTPGPIASPDPGDCHGSLSLDRDSLGGIFVLSTWDVSGGSLRFQTPPTPPGKVPCSLKFKHGCAHCGSAFTPPAEV